MEANGGWLLILDNVDDRREVQQFVLARGEGHVLLTSREPVFAELGIPRAVGLRDFDTEEGVRFLLRRAGREDADSNDRAAVAELAAELGKLPLALEQAAAYIAEINAAFSPYLVAFRKTSRYAAGEIRRLALVQHGYGYLVSQLQCRGARIARRLTSCG
jgi:hypothetical protein